MKQRCVLVFVSAVGPKMCICEGSDHLKDILVQEGKAPIQPKGILVRRRFIVMGKSDFPEPMRYSDQSLPVFSSCLAALMNDNIGRAEKSAKFGCCL